MQLWHNVVLEQPNDKKGDGSLSLPLWQAKLSVEQATIEQLIFSNSEALLPKAMTSVGQIKVKSWG